MSPALVHWPRRFCATAAQPPGGRSLHEKGGHRPGLQVETAVRMNISAKIAGKRIFEMLGLEVRKKRAPQASRASMTGCLRQMYRLGFRPRTVIDVGVADETEDLYREFPEAEILLIEPLAEFEPSLRKICVKYRAHYVLAAAGAKPGKAILNIHEEQHSSSLFKEVEGASVDGLPREVRVVTVDQVCQEKELKGPYLLKVDVQGAELEVLAGSRETLRSTEAIYLEVSLLGMFVGAPQLCDVVKAMKELGFVVYDIAGLLYRPLDLALAQVDLVFVKDVGKFRESHAFATSEQRKELAKAPDQLVTGLK
jgi:FkbM family methyltransferase